MHKKTLQTQLLFWPNPLPPANRKKGCNGFDKFVSKIGVGIFYDSKHNPFLRYVPFTCSKTSKEKGVCIFSALASKRLLYSAQTCIFGRNVCTDNYFEK